MTTLTGRLIWSPDITGVYRRCLGCEAPIVHPFPGVWHLDLIKEGPADGPVDTFFTPHYPSCLAPSPVPEPGMAIRVSGESVIDLEVGL